MDTNICIACLRQVVAFAPKVIIIACLRQVVAFAPNVSTNAPPTASPKGGGQRYGFININDMYNNDVGKGGAQGCEAYEVK